MDYIDEALTRQVQEVLGPHARVCVTGGGVGDHQAWIEFDDGIGVNLGLDLPSTASRAIVEAIVRAMLEHKDAIRARVLESGYGQY